MKTFLYFVAYAVIILGTLWICNAHARDLGQWENTDPAVREWYSQLKQPDNPTVSCCGEADAYWCDGIKTKTDYLGNKSTFCIITDDRDDELLGRKHVEIGTEILIPDHKLTWKDGNPTGHAIVFLGGNYVFCFVQNGGV